MPTDKHNSRMARAKDLISSLIKVASSGNVPFHKLQQLQCLHHGATSIYTPLCLHSFFTTRKVTICGRHVMASVRDIKISEALLIYSLLTMLWNKPNIAGVMAFTHQDMGHVFHEHILRIFRNGWMDCRDSFHAVLCLYCCVTDRT